MRPGALFLYSYTWQYRTGKKQIVGFTLQDGCLCLKCTVKTEHLPVNHKLWAPAFVQWNLGSIEVGAKTHTAYTAKSVFHPKVLVCADLLRWLRN